MAIPAGMSRLTVDLAIPLRRDLELAAEVDEVRAPARLRALATLWQTDPQLQERVRELAHEQMSEARERAVRSRRQTLRERRVG